MVGRQIIVYWFLYLHIIHISSCSHLSAWLSDFIMPRGLWVKAVDLIRRWRTVLIPLMMMNGTARWDRFACNKGSMSNGKAFGCLYLVWNLSQMEVLCIVDWNKACGGSRDVVEGKPSSTHWNHYLLEIVDPPFSANVKRYGLKSQYIASSSRLIPVTW